VRLGTLDATDAEANMTAARAAVQLGDTTAAVGFLKEAAEVLAKMRRDAEALDALVEAATVDPNDVELRVRISRDFVRRGEIERARPFLTRETTADDPDLLVALARIEMDSGREIEARTTLTRLLTLAPARHEEVTRLAETLLESGRVDSGFGCIEVVTDAALLEGHWLVAIRSLQTFVRRHRRHVPALSRLVEVCAEAGMDEELREAQADLVDAYLESGLGAEARVIAEDLVARDPQAADNVDRLRRVLDLLHVPDVERVVGERLTATYEPEDAERREVAVAVSAGESVVSEVSTDEEPAFVLDPQEVDLTDALAGIGAIHAPPAPQPPPTPQDLETVFDRIRTRVSHDQEAAVAAEEYERGVQLLFGGDALEAVSHLQNAARMPLWRFKAAAELGRLYIAREDLPRAVEWLERAAEAPAPTEEEGFAVLYDLAVALEGLAESARALAILMELHADAEGYRDVRERLDRLARVQTGNAPQ
jgi:tetratricopeptide (TPR) repeat protein